MQNSKMYEDIVNYMLYPTKIPASVFFSDVSRGEYMLIGAFLKYEKDHGGEHITVNDLASELKVAVPAVSRTLKNLESRGLITRQTDKDCRRNTLVLISEKGMQLFRENEKQLRKFIDKIISVFTHEEIDQLIRFHNRIENVMEEEIDNIETSRKDKSE